MRLTTRLMQLASWLLLQRAVNEGELTAENARTEKEKVKFSATPSERGGPGFDELPTTLAAFIDKGDRLFERVQQFDKLERGKMVEVPARLGRQRHRSAVAAAGGVRPAEGLVQALTRRCAPTSPCEGEVIRGPPVNTSPSQGEVDRAAVG